MHVSGRKFQNGPCYVKGNGCKDNRVVVELEAKVNVEGQGIYSGPVGNDSFRAFIQEHK